MPPYHPGKVLKVIRSGPDIQASDDTVQVLIETWDEVVWTISLDPSLQKAPLKEGEIVLADWSNTKETKSPRMVIVKIIRGQKGEELWDVYKNHFEKTRDKAQTSSHQHQYIG